VSAGVHRRQREDKRDPDEDPLAVNKKKIRAGSQKKLLGALRLIRETGSDPPVGQLGKRMRCRSPQDIHALMHPYAEREEVEVFWILALDSQSQVWTVRY